MNHSHHDFLLLSLFLITLLLACRSENPVDPPASSVSWTAHPEFISHYQRAYNLVQGEEELLVYGESFCSRINQQHDASHCLSAPERIDFKFPASDKIRFYGYEFSSLIGVDPWCCEAHAGAIVIDLAEDSLFEKVIYNQHFPGRANTIGFDGESVFLIPARGKNLDRPLFYLLRVNLEPLANESFRLSLDTLQRVIIEGELVTSMAIVNIEYLKGEFWVSFFDQSNPSVVQRTYRINPDGRYEKSADMTFNELFLSGDHIIGTRQSFIYGYANIWEEWFPLRDATISQVSFQEIRGEQLFYGSDFVGSLHVQPQVLGTKIFPNEGMEGRVITDIEVWGDRLYVATTSGLFWTLVENLP